MNIIRKTVPFEVKALTEDEEFFYFEGYGSTFDNADYYDDVMVKGAFVESLGKRMPKLPWQHRMDEPVGIYESAVEDAKGLFVKGKLPKMDTFVAGRVIPQMKIGSVTDMSIGFSISDYDKDIEIKDGIRYIKKVELWECSLVTLPANDQANVLAIKSAIDEHMKNTDNKKDISYIDLKELDERTLEAAFKEGKSFDKKAAVALVSIIKKSDLRDAKEDFNRDGDIDWRQVLGKLDETTKSITEEK